MKIREGLYVRWAHKEKRETLCVVERNGVELKGIARVGHGDEFRKAVGRKFSLKRAIQDLSKEERSVIWRTLRDNGVSFV